MKKLIFLFCLPVLAGMAFQSCNNSKTYAERLEEERDAISRFVKDSAFTIISEAQFKANGYKTDVKRKEFVYFNNGVYLQIIDAGSTLPTDTFTTNEILTVRYLERNVVTRKLTTFNVPLEEYMNNYPLYSTPLSLRYEETVGSSVTLSGKMISPYDYAWYSTYGSQTNGLAIPQGWLAVLEYVRSGANFRLIVPSKMGHNNSSLNVIPYYYEIRELKKAKS